MIKRWQRVLNQINRLIDFFIVGASYYGATCFWLLVVRHDPNHIALQPKNLFVFALIFAVASVFGYQLAKLYDSIRGKSFNFDIKWVLFVNAVTVLGGGTLLYLFRLTNFSRASLALFYLLSSVLVLSKRMLVRVVLSRYRSKGYNLKHVVLIGSGALAHKYRKTILEAPQFGYTIDGYIGKNGEMENLPCLGEWAAVGAAVLSNVGLDEVVVALELEQTALLPQIIAATEKYGTKISIIPYYNDYIPSSTTIQTLGECKLLSLRTTPLDFLGNALVKRLFDIVFSLLLIVITSPVMLFAAVGTLLSSPGPIIFKQTRVGKTSVCFRCISFAPCA